MSSKIVLLLYVLSFPIVLSAQLSFSEDFQNEFLGVNEGDQRFADFDNDGDLDLIYIGYAEQFDAKAILFLNDGEGIFTEKSTIIEGVGYSTLEVADVDNDEDIDILIAGQYSGGVSTVLYLNDGNANFTAVNNSAFPAMMNGQVDFADIDQDGDQDVLMLGTNANLTQAITDLYRNNGNGEFSLITNSPLIKVYQGANDFADIDGDGDLDLVISGVLGSNFESSTSLYLNDGDGNYSINEDNDLIDVRISSTNFADIDGDGDPDLLLTGSSSTVFNTALYRNDGNGGFTIDTQSSLVEVIFGACSFADVDQDSDLDLIITGRKGPIPDETAELYINNGTGFFSKLANTPFVGATAGGAQFADVNGDDNPDIFITGSAPDLQSYSKLYINNLPVSNNETDNDTQSKVSPNPCSDLLSLEINSSSTMLYIQIFNNLGQSVLSKKISNSTTLTLSVDHLVAGIYNLKWKDENGFGQVVKFIKE